MEDIMKKIMGFLLMSAIVMPGSALLHAQDEPKPKNDKKLEAQKEKKKKKVYTLGEILVRDKKVTPGVTSVIEGKEVKNSTKTNAINLVSEKVPSFHTGNNRVMGFGVAGSGAASMSIRGIGVSAWSPQSGSGPTTGIPILINGLDVGMMINNHPVADIFSMKNIRRIEVLHGPQPVLYGGGAMGGIINIITDRREHDGYDTDISASYGSWNTTEDYVSHKGKIGSFDYGVSYNFRYSDGSREQVINGTKFDSQYMSNNGTLHAGYQVNKNWYVGLDSYLMGLEINDPGAIGETDDGLENFNILRSGSVIQVGNDYGKLEGSLQLYGNWGKHKSYLPASGNQQSYDSFDQMLGMKLKESLELDFGMTVTGGTEYRWYGGKSQNKVTGFVYTDDQYIHEGSFYALVDQSFFKKLWSISAGGRYTYNSEYGSYGAWQAGTIVRPFKTTKIHFQSAQGFKVPDIIQIFNKWRDQDNNTTESGIKLDPETYVSIELGVEQSFIKKIVISATGYYIMSDNRFSRYIALGETYWYNMDEFNYFGMETSVAYKPIKKLTLSAGYSFIDTDQNGEILPYVPKHKLLLNVLFEGFGLMVNMGGEYVCDIYASSGEKTFPFGTVIAKKLDNYFIMNLKVAYTFLKHYRVFADFNNITDNDYSTYAVYKTPPVNSYLDYPMPGFNWRLGVSASF